jgi:hypothetical protein
MDAETRCRPDADPMSADPMAAGQIPSPAARERADALLWAGIAVMGELQASLHSSRKAVLALDLDGIEQETGKQAGLIREFESLERRGVGMPATESKKQRVEREEDVPPARLAATPGLPEQFRRNADSILQAARLQAALLARAQSKLRVLANMLAGPSVIYGPPPGQSGAPDAFGRKRSGEI